MNYEFFNEAMVAEQKFKTVLFKTLEVGVVVRNCTFILLRWLNSLALHFRSEVIIYDHETNP